MKALILLADGFDDLQLFYPWYRLLEEDFPVTLATPSGLPAVGLHGYRAQADLPIDELNTIEYDLLILPGGEAPGRLRIREVAVGITRSFMEDGRRVIAIGYGPQLLISAGCLDGRRVTCVPVIRDDVRAAGATYVDAPLVQDGQLLSCRDSSDLPVLGQVLLPHLSTRVERPKGSLDANTHTQFLTNFGMH